MSFLFIVIAIVCVPLIGGIYFLFRGLLSKNRQMWLLGLGFIIAWALIIYQFSSYLKSELGDSYGF